LKTASYYLKTLTTTGINSYKIKTLLEMYCFYWDVKQNLNYTVQDYNLW